MSVLGLKLKFYNSLPNVDTARVILITDILNLMRKLKLLNTQRFPECQSAKVKIKFVTYHEISFVLAETMYIKFDLNFKRTCLD